MKNWCLRIALSVSLLGACAVSSSAQCAGDCSGDGEVSIEELIRSVNIALALAPISTCPSVDANGDGSVTIDEIIGAVTRALGGCSPAAGTPTRTPTPAKGTATPTRTPTLAKGTATPTRTPTPAKGTATPTQIVVPGCDNGTVTGTFSSVTDTNARTTTANLTLVAASQVRDPGSGAYGWQIVGNTCTAEAGLIRSIQIQLFGPRTGFAPGTYAITPPLGSLVYAETPAVGIPQPRIWNTTGATLVIESVSGGALSFRIDPAPMVPNPIVSGNPKPTGRFNLAVTGRINRITSN